MQMFLDGDEASDKRHGGDMPSAIVCAGHVEFLNRTLSQAVTFVIQNKRWPAVKAHVA
ncbi:MAG: hypothetical protein WC617_20200 [Rhodanobacter sp.]|jgi:hypothetical protein